MQGTILVIDGVSTNRIVLKVQLTAACFQVLQADSLSAAMALMKDNRPDLVLTAMSLPETNHAWTLTARPTGPFSADEHQPVQTLAGHPAQVSCGAAVRDLDLLLVAERTDSVGQILDERAAWTDVVQRKGCGRIGFG